MYNKLEQILTLIKEIKIENELIGDLLLINFKSAINTIDAMKNNDAVDISEKIKIISELLGINIEDLIKGIIESDYTNSGFLKNETDQETIDFILGTAQNINNTNIEIDDYEKFLEENKVKENLDYLKGVL